MVTMITESGENQKDDKAAVSSALKKPNEKPTSHNGPASGDAPNILVYKKVSALNY
jgi:hypothetical protein